MKKLSIVFGLMAVAALVTWRVASRRNEAETSATRRAQSPGISRPDSMAFRPRTSRATSQTNVSADSMTPNGSTVAFQEMKIAREAMRQKLRDEGNFPEVFAKEAQWQEKFKGLKKGMKLQEVAVTMGEPPTLLLALVNSAGSPEFVSVPTNSYPNVTGPAAAYYSPDGLPPVDLKAGPRSGRLPFDFFSCNLTTTES